ncbi:hypothetical protein MKW92_004368, partial [Papaver armeniacum]
FGRKGTNGTNKMYEMVAIGLSVAISLSVSPGLTISTEACQDYHSCSMVGY